MNMKTEPAPGLSSSTYVAVEKVMAGKAAGQTYYGILILVRLMKEFVNEKEFSLYR